MARLPWPPSRRYAPPLILIGAGILLAAAARPGAPAGVALVDTQRVIQHSVHIQTVIAEVAKPAEEIKGQAEARQAEHQTAIERYKAQKAAVSDEENERRLKEIQKMEDEIEELRFKLNREIARANEITLTSLGSAVTDAIAEVARARQITVILKPDATLFFDPAADLTDAVIAYLDSK